MLNLNYINTTTLISIAFSSISAQEKGIAYWQNKGVIFNFGIGYKFQLTENLFMVSDVFYSHKTVSLTDEGIGTSDNVVKVNGFGISFGAIF